MSEQIYKLHTRRSFEQCGHHSKRSYRNIQLVYEYASTPEVMRLVKEFDLDIQSRNFEADCKIIADYKLRDKEKCFERMELLQAMGVKIYYDSIV